MPKVAYSEEDKERIKTELVTVGLELMAKQGEYAKLFEIQSYYYQNNSNQEYESDLDPSLGISSYQG